MEKAADDLQSWLRCGWAAILSVRTSQTSVAISVCYLSLASDSIIELGISFGESANGSHIPESYKGAGNWRDELERRYVRQYWQYSYSFDSKCMAALTSIARQFRSSSVVRDSFRSHELSHELSHGHPEVHRVGLCSLACVATCRCE